MLLGYYAFILASAKKICYSSVVEVPVFSFLTKYLKFCLFLEQEDLVFDFTDFVLELDFGDLVLEFDFEYFLQFNFEDILIFGGFIYVFFKLLLLERLLILFFLY